MHRQTTLFIAAIAAALSSAHASPVTYNVDFSLPDYSPATGTLYSITGSITTNGKIGALSTSDIDSVDIAFDGKHAKEFQIVNFYGFNPVQTTSDGKLLFKFDNSSYANADRFLLQDYTYGPYIQFFSESGYNFVSAYDGHVSTSSAILPQGSTFTIGTTTVSAVPLPSSAPMFGAALVAMGMAGYGLKRRRMA